MTNNISEANLECVGLRYVTIVDQKCDMECEIEAHDFDSTYTVMDRYIVKSGRVWHQDGCVLRFEGIELPTPRDDPSSNSTEEPYSIYQMLERNGGYFSPTEETRTIQLDYSHEGVFPVIVHCKDPDAIGRQSHEYTVEIQDHFRIMHIKEKFSEKKGARILTEKDKLHWNFHNLEDHEFVVTYKLEAKADVEVTLNTERTKGTHYICGDCGSDEYLTKDKQCVCHWCGNRILYKKRTLNPVEYRCV